MTDVGSTASAPGALRGFRLAFLSVLGVGAAASVAAFAWAGRPQVLGVAVAVLLVAGFFLLGSGIVAVVTIHAPRLSLLVALLTYVMQVLLLAAVLAALTGRGPLVAVDPRWLGFTVIAGSLAWTTALVVSALGRPSRHGSPR